MICKEYVLPQSFQIPRNGIGIKRQKKQGLKDKSRVKTNNAVGNKTKIN